MATIVTPPMRLPFVAAGLGVAALLLASCGGGTAAPAAPGATPTALPAGEWIDVQQADALWQEITQAATLVKPVLRPTYLPTGLSEVQRLNTEQPQLQFAIVYSDADHQEWMSLTAGALGSPALASRRALLQQVFTRQTYATYQLYDDENPTGAAWLIWQEPGTWGAPGDPNLPNLDHVPYFMSSRGLPKDELIKVVESLQPVEE